MMEKATPDAPIVGLADRLRLVAIGISGAIEDSRADLSSLVILSQKESMVSVFTNRWAREAWTSG